ncbi:MAG: hypothetical protein ATN32_01610 [Candidatus Epulonipiscium fishelsonii]|nr:MAG: hypothetical protein ATN32_01610 [Epulopiscium sp. AS2M-Bin002]
MKVKGLGNGVNALFMDDIDELLIDSKSEDADIPIESILPNKNQPRKIFDETSLEELASSIKEYGILQPILVAQKDNKYQIIAGERRYRAAKIAGLEQIPVIIKDLTEEQIATISLIENVQRKDLNVVELAEGYKFIIDNFNITQEQLALKVGKKRSSITNILRINELSSYIKEKLLNNKINFSHAKAILSIEDLHEREKLVDYIIKNDISVRQLYSYIEIYKKKAKDVHETKEASISEEIKTYYKKIETILKNTLGTNVKLITTNKQHDGKSVSKIEIEYYSKEHLENIIKLMEPNNIIN